MINLQNVSKSYRRVCAVNNVSLEISSGQFVALLGPNGAGKTTLVEMIEGLAQPDQGQIFIDGKSWKTDADALRRMMGVSLQETKFMDKQTIGETFALFASFYGLSESDVHTALDRVGLTPLIQRDISRLSGGQHQKVALGLALLNSPKLLILDEPTTGLDPNSRREIWAILKALKKDRVTLILTTHYMEEAQTLCDRVVMLNEGTVIADGTMADLLKQHLPFETIHFVVESDRLPDLFPDGPIFKGLTWNPTSGQGQLRVPDIVTGLPAFMDVIMHNQLHLSQLECRPQTLDDLFITLTGRHLHE